MRGRPTCSTIWACRVSGMAAGSPFHRCPSTCAVTRAAVASRSRRGRAAAPRREQVAERVAGAGHLDHAGRLARHDRVLAGAGLDVRHGADPRLADADAGRHEHHPRVDEQLQVHAERDAARRSARQRRRCRPRPAASVNRSPTPIGRGSGAYPALPQAASSRLTAIAAASGRSDTGRPRTVHADARGRGQGKQTPSMGQIASPGVPLISRQEATTRIELVWTALQAAA